MEFIFYNIYKVEIKININNKKDFAFDFIPAHKLLL